MYTSLILIKNRILLTCALIATSVLKIFAQESITPDNAKIEYQGRVDFTNPKAPTFEFPGVSIKAKFTGSSLAMKMHDYATHTATTTNYYYKIIDGGVPEKFEAIADDHTYFLATGLSSGSHTIEIIKLTESTVGKSTFHGFILDKGKMLEKITDVPSQSIEFIGNSITCGYGNEVNLADPGTKPGFHSINENNYNAWGYIAARNLSLSYRAVAYSGRGMYRNNSGSTEGTLPKIYDKIFPDNPNSPTWNHQAHHPDYIVINLGTNDFALDPGNPLDEALFKSTYTSFVERLRSLHPKAIVICASGVMMSNAYPAGANQWTRITNDVKEVVTELTRKGLDDIFYFEMNPQSSPYGEDWHPSLKTHQEMASQLTEFIKRLGTR